VLGHDCEEETAGASEDELADAVESSVVADESPVALSVVAELVLAAAPSLDTEPLAAELVLAESACLPANATVPHAPASSAALEAATTWRILRRRSAAVGTGMANTMAAGGKQLVKRA
jgi:hypothetical protein